MLGLLDKVERTINKVNRWLPSEGAMQSTQGPLKAVFRIPFPEQKLILDSIAKRIVVKSGRRFGKSTTAATKAVEGLLKRRRTLYAVPTQEQIDRFWYETKLALAEPLAEGLLYKHEGRHIIEIPGTEARIRAKTAYNADTLRGDFADLLILDEYQLMDPDAWELVGAPMLLDNNGDAMFFYTQKPRGKHHSANLLKKAQEDTSGRWEAFIFPSLVNPHLSKAALADIVQDMTREGYQSEILAEDVGYDPKALWSPDDIKHTNKLPRGGFLRVVVAVDPQSTTGQTGVIVAGSAYGFDSEGKDELHVWIIDDATPEPGVKPSVWASAAVSAYYKHQADLIIGEVNHGGDMIENTIRNVEGGIEVSYKTVRASRGKAVRADPVSAAYQKDKVFHLGDHPDLEEELCSWVPGESKWSPNRLDAMVYAVTELLDLSTGSWEDVTDLGDLEDFESQWA